MGALKKHKLKIGLIAALVLSVFLCVYTIGNHKGNSTVNQNGRAQFGFNGGGRNQFSQNDNRGNMQNQQSPPSNSQQDQNTKQNNSTQGQGNDKQMAPPNATQGWSQGQPRGPSGEGMWSGNGGGGNANSSYSPILITYSLIFIAIFIAMYVFYKHKKIKVNLKDTKFIILSLIAVALLLRISLGLSFEGFSSDLNLFKNWATSAANSLSGFYANARSSDYPPAYIYVLFLVGKLVSITALSPYFTLIIKLPSIMADIATAYLIYRVAKKHLSIEISILLLAFYLFNPAVFINSTLWGQVDSFFTLIIVSAVLLMSEGKIALSSIIFTVGVLMKPQGIIYLPVVFFELVRQKNIKNFLKAAVCAVVTAAAIMLPFSLNKGITWIFQLFSGTLSEYPYASVNGYNFYSLIGKNYTNDASTFFIFSYHVWGTIFIILITLFTWFIYIKGNNKLYASAAALIQIAGVFTFSTRMHERYLFPAAVLAILTFVYLKDKRILLLTLGFSITIYMNTHSILFQSGMGMNSSSYSPSMFITSLLNVVLFGYLVKVVWDIVIRKKVKMLE